MKRQHNEMRVRLESFHDQLCQLSESRDLEGAVQNVKKNGKDLTRMMRLHIAT